MIKNFGKIYKGKKHSGIPYNRSTYLGLVSSRMSSLRKRYLIRDVKDNWNLFVTEE